MIKRFVCGAAVGAVLLFSGAALSGNPTTTSDDQLMNFNQSTGELLAIPQGSGLSAFIHSPATLHLIADLSKFLPPDPCTPLARIWNTGVRIETETGLQFPVFFEFMLVLMTDAQCKATITTTNTPSSTAQPMISIAPSGS